MIPGPSIEYEDNLEGNGCDLHNDDPDENEILNRRTDDYDEE